MQNLIKILLFLCTFSLVYPDSLDKDINIYNPSEMNFFNLGYLEIYSSDSSMQNIPGDNYPGWLPWSQFNFDKNKISNYYWIRTKIIITNKVIMNPGIIPQMFVSAFEVYWDNKLIGRNGKIGNNSAKEEPGYFTKRFFLKEELCSPGVHSLVIKVSNFHSSSDLRRGFILFGSIPGIMSYISSWLIRFSFILGIVFISSIFNLFLFLTSKKKSYLIFSLLCLVVLSSSIINLYWVFYNVKITYLDILNTWLPVTSVLIGILFPLFFLFEFFIENKKIIAGIFLSNILVYLVFPNEWYFNNSIIYLQVISSTVIIIYALFKKKSGSVIAILGIVASIIIYFFDFKTGINNQTIISVVFILFYNLYLSMQFSKREKTEREALLKSSRLENELLKKNINPHFLMNSLNSITVWLRKDPEKAIKLVNSLADEFRLVSQISDLKLISIKKEIELCKAHIEIMNYRKGAKFCFTTEGIKGDEEISPMIFHTMVENGITHGYENKNEGYFKLSKNETERYVSYKLFNDSQIKENYEVKEGTGIKYIKSRLEESYNSNWKLNYGPVNGGWEVNIEIFK